LLAIDDVIEVAQLDLQKALAKKSVRQVAGRRAISRVALARVDDKRRRRRPVGGAAGRTREAVGYEFDWGQIIEEVFDGNSTADSDNPAT